MNRCKNCESDDFQERTLDEYEYTVLDVPFRIILEASVSEKVCRKCGVRRSITIPNQYGLESLVALKRIADGQKLSGREVRFLRKILGLPSKQLARDLGMAPETLSKIENGRMAISDPHERNLRTWVWLERIWHVPAVRNTRASCMELRRLKIRPARVLGDPPVYRFVAAPLSETEISEHIEKCSDTVEQLMWTNDVDGQKLTG
jgi:transcriptional regulator with XRE-family HTH domain